ncbi:MAG: response regulator [Emcibacter sp.]|nr:response regulator [Emcibacter sp.]
MPDSKPCLKILIADDNVINHAILKNFLHSMGHEINTAKTGLEAIEALRGKKFDLIFMDIQMPEMDGTTASLLIRKIPGSKSGTPIIACTADVMDKHIKEYKQAGMNGLIQKPIQKDELVGVINDFLADTLHFPVNKKSTRTTTQSPIQNTARKSVALKNLLKEIGG